MSLGTIASVTATSVARFNVDNRQLWRQKYPSTNWTQKRVVKNKINDTGQEFWSNSDIRFSITWYEWKAPPPVDHYVIWQLNSEMSLVSLLLRRKKALTAQTRALATRMLNDHQNRAALKVNWQDWLVTRKRQRPQLSPGTRNVNFVQVLANLSRLLHCDDWLQLFVGYLHTALGHIAEYHARKKTKQWLRDCQLRDDCYHTLRMGSCPSINTL